MFGNFYALDRMNISDAAMLNKMSPFFSVLASMFILGEKPTFVSVLSLIAAFSGSLLVIKPSFDFTKFFPALVGFAGGIGAGIAYTFVRKLHSYKVNGNLIIAFFSAFSCLLAVPYMIFNYTPMTTKQLLLLLGAGVAAACGQIGVTGAYFNAPASKISIYEYTQIIFSAILGFLAFGQIPDATSIIGYTIIIGSAAAVFFYNSHKQKTQAHLS
ncbi:DMT family transporter [uncultured Treponema sp.]|uniref:DMT family transporter n=1 Tax=uncultured Treponema sp. TaxID=162155 RepID=UPI0027D9C8B4|nr:DMT family transporter [uncultured Treponema sp.]